jgi:ATP-binding cassette, subfamily A (ABC1), member 3
MELNEETVQISNLTKVYPSGKKAVDSLSLTMYKGQIFVLLGHNGAGKSTTISMLIGLLEFTLGEAKIFGKSVAD